MTVRITETRAAVAGPARGAGARVAWRRLAAATTVAVALIVGLGWAMSGPATAQQTGGPLYDTKVFYPKTGSYYEMVRSTPGYSIRGNNPEISWSRAAQRAGGSSFKGFKGRLAVVRTPDVNRFLMETFRPNQAVWIGLRYWCSFNKLQWIDGKFHDRSDWANWDAGWNHAGGARSSQNEQRTCSGKNDYWPVHYWPVKDGFRWNANGPVKEFYAYFVEYPTGRE